MMTDSLNRKEAAELFLNLLIIVAYDGAIEDVTSILEDGPPGRKPRQDLVTLHQWFRNLSGESREHLFAIIREVSSATLFHCLVLLDGLAGNPVEGKVSDFAVYFLTYEDQDARKADSPQTSVRLSSPYPTEYLHDIFHRILQERAEPGKSD
jgi:hypothetical protein